MIQLNKFHYPRQRLLFFVAQDVNDEIRRAVKNLLEEIAEGCSWQVSAPEFVDAISHSETREGDCPEETVGGLLEIYSARDGLPEHLDAQALANVELLVKAVQGLSLSYPLEFEFELDGVFVGVIENGALDDTLEQGLLGEWRRHLEKGE